MKKIYNILNRNKIDIFIVIYLTTFIFIRYLSYGFNYFYQLDDYIQYFSYFKFIRSFDLIVQQGLLTSRPLAGIFDIYIWGNFFDNMLVAVFLISLLYAISGVLFLKIFRKYFNTGFMFVVFYSLMPFFFEGVYWVSASSRIVVGLFFIAISVFCLQKFFDRNKKIYIFLFAIFQLIAICMYEQILILSTVLSFILIMFNIKNNKKNFLLILILLVNIAIYIFVTSKFSVSTSAIGSRMEIVYPMFNTWYFKNFIGSIIEQLKTVFIDVPMKITFTGFFRSLKIIIDDKLWFVIPISLIFSYFSYLFCKKECKYNEINKNKKITIFVGLILAMLPISLFFVISNPYISMRNILPSFLGLAIIFDMLFSYFACREKFLMQIIAAVMVFVFFIASVSEIHDYKVVYDFDVKIGNNIKEKLDENKSNEKTAFIIQSGAKGTINTKYHEHGYGVLSSNWALEGFLNYLYASSDGIKNGISSESVIPIEVENNIYHYAWEKDKKLITNFKQIYYWDSTLSKFIEVYINEITDDIFELVDDDENVIATLKEHNDIGYIFFNQS